MKRNRILTNDLLKSIRR